MKVKYGIEKEKYLYTVSSMLPHKNLLTLLKLVERLKKQNLIPSTLLISGVAGKSLEETKSYINKRGLQKDCILTGFISDEERNTLMRDSFIFLFPSIFEGFGMPVIESMLFGKNVVATSCACIPEVSKGNALYVSNPYSVKEWEDILTKLYENEWKRKVDIEFPEYDIMYSTNKYLELFKTLRKKINI